MIAHIPTRIKPAGDTEHQPRYRFKDEVQGHTRSVDFGTLIDHQVIMRYRGVKRERLTITSNPRIWFFPRKFTVDYIGTRPKVVLVRNIKVNDIEQLDKYDTEHGHAFAAGRRLCLDGSLVSFRLVKKSCAPDECISVAIEFLDNCDFTICFYGKAIRNL